MSALYSIALENLPEFLRNRENVLSALLNYALWRGRFSWIHSLASLCCENALFHLRTFELSALSLAYTRQYPLAEFYYRAIPKPSSHFDLCYKKLIAPPSKIKKEQNPKNLSSFPGKEDVLLDRYAALLSLGLLFRATRLLLRYLKERGMKTYLLDVILQSYLQNQKYYAYLLRILSSSFQMEKKHWYELEYCITRLHLESARDKILKNVTKAKKDTSKFLEALEQRYFRSLIEGAKQEEVPIPLKTDPSYSNLIINYYLSIPISEKIILKRRYALYQRIFQTPLEQREEIDPIHTVNYASSLFWTLYLYLDILSGTPFLYLLESQAGQNLSLRALLAIYHFRRGSRKLSEKLIFPTSHNHPMLKTLQIELLLEKGNLGRAERIARKLTQSYPKDPVLQSNYALLKERIGRNTGK